MKRAQAVGEIHLSPKVIVSPGKKFEADDKTVDALILSGNAKECGEDDESEVVSVKSAGKKGSGNDGLGL